jgi:hypothetical protein
VDPSKLLPSIGSSSAIIKSVQGGLISFDPSNKKSKVSAENEEKKQVKYQTTLRKELLAIRSKTLKIEDLLKNNFLLNKKTFNVSRKQKENETRSEREKKLEKKKTKFGNIEIPSAPQFGFLDAIKRFIFFTFLGLAAPTLIKLIPKLIDLGKNLQPMIKFLTDIGKGFLNGLVTFIDWGYKIQDSTKDTFKKIGGNQAEKQFDNFVKTLNTFIDLSILAGLTALDVGIDAEKYRRKLYDKDQRTRPGQQRGRVRPTTGQGDQSGLGRGAAVTSGRGGARNLGRGAAVTTGQGGAQNLGAKLSSGPFAKFAGPLKKFLGAAAPGAGAVLGALDAKARFDAGDKIGGTLAATSAALDTFAAGVGIAALATSALALTGVGAAVPAALISAAGIAQAIATGIDVVLLVRDLVKAFFPDIPMFSNGGRIKLYAKGGRIGESGRSIKVGRKIPKIVEKQQVTPGKDVGGKNQILKLFPDSSPQNQRATSQASPWWERWLFGSTGQQNQNQQLGGKPANPLKALESTAKTLTKIPGPIGLLMSAGSLIPLGQKPSKDLGTSFGNMIGGLTQDVIDNNINLSFGDIMRFISGYANGGDLRTANIIQENNLGQQIGSMVGRAINSMVSSQVDVAIRDIYREISTIGRPDDRLKPGPPGPPGPLGDVIVSSDQPDFWLLATAALFENSDPQGAADVAQVLYNRVSAPEDPWKTNRSLRKAILSPAQFTPVSGYGGVPAWSQITDKNSAIAFVTKNRKTQNQLETVSAALLDTTRQRSAMTFVGPRDSFRATTHENIKYDQLANETEVTRHGHIFGFEPAGAQIAAFKAGKLRPAEINKTIVSGTVSSGQLPLTGDNGRMKPSQLIKVGTLSSSPDGGPYWYGNGAYLRKSDAGPAFLNAKQAAAKEGITMVINSAYRSLEHQKALQGKYAVVAAVGRSPHGEGIALDIQTGTRGWNWLKTNGPTYGWRWMAIPDDEVHFEYVGGVKITSPKQEPPVATPSSTGRPSTAEQLKGKIQTQTQKNWTPPKDSIVFTIPGKGTYYADMKSNKIYDSNGVIVDVSGGKNKWVIEGLRNKKQTNPELFRTSASIQPPNTSTLAKVTQGLNQEPSYGDGFSVAMVHHTIIIKETDYIPMSGGGVNNMDPLTSALDFTPSLT